MVKSSNKGENLSSPIASKLWSKGGLVVGNKPAKSPLCACSRCKVIKLYVPLHLSNFELCRQNENAFHVASRILATIRF